MAHLALTPPAAFLPSPGEPSTPFTSWMCMFENFMLAVNDDALSDARKRALLIHCRGTEGQRLFYTLPVDGDTYSAAVGALTAFFMPKVNVVFERYKFRQRTQRPGESTAQFVAALREIAVKCEFSDLSDEMI